MNEAVAVPSDGFLTTADLAGRPDFTLGLAAISPSMRTIAGPGGTADVEPRVMQVLLVLADAAGQVVTRETLFRRCWGNPYVGDDSLNRAVGAVRKLASEIGGGSFEVETVPRTGYRLTAAIGPAVGGVANGEEQRSGWLSRRSAMVGGGAALALSGAGLWWAARSRSEYSFDTLIARGDEAFRNGTAFADSTILVGSRPGMAGLYQQAVGLNPGSAKAWGLLAYFQSLAANDASAEDTAARTANAQNAIRHALDIDPMEPNARVAMYLLQGRMLDWIGRDRALRAILATDRDNLPAMAELMPLIQAAGLTRESWTWNERILARSPFAQPFLVVRAMKLWILGRIQESDNVIDRVRGLWPAYEFGFSKRFMLFALTGRPAAARAMLESSPERIGDAQGVALWRAALKALETQAPADIEKARSLCVASAKRSPPLVNDVVMLLGALGQTDAAFDVTDGFVLWRGKVVSANQADGKSMDDYSRRMTQWLFTPPLAAMRADPRFEKLCDEVGLRAYWRARNVRPDYLAYG